MAGGTVSRDYDRLAPTRHHERLLAAWLVMRRANVLCDCSMGGVKELHYETYASLTFPFVLPLITKVISNSSSVDPNDKLNIFISKL